MRWFFWAVLTGCCQIASLAVAADDPDEIRLNDYRWQSLPVGIENVVAGPDGRIWYQDGRRLWSGNLTQHQAHIAEEFAKKTPRIQGAELVLFEPGGRVWFYSPPLFTLLGYDGSNWITKKNPVTNWIRGRCLTRGALIDPDAHRFAGGAAWFTDYTGVHRFDGEKWSYQEIVPGPPSPQNGVLLSVYPDGKTVAAHHRSSPDLWIYRDGVWKKHRDVMVDVPGGVNQLAFESARSLLYTSFGGPHKLQRLRLTDDGMVQPDESGVLLLSKMRVESVIAMHTDPEGRIYLAADVIRDPQNESASGGGIVVQEPSGKARVIRDPRLVSQWRTFGPSTAPPLRVPSRNQIWLCNGFSQQNARLLDLDKGGIVAEASHSNIRCLHAIDDAGRLFVSRGPTDDHTRPILVYSPQGQERKVLAVSAKEIRHEPIVISEDGAIWAVEPKGHVVRWDNQEWKRVFPDPFNSVGVIRGQGNVVILETNGVAALCEGAKVIARGELLELIENERDRIAKSFRRPPPVAIENGMPSFEGRIASDSNGKIWVLDGSSLRVLDGDRWHDATDALVAAGMRSGSAGAIVPMGAGDKIFFSNFGPHSQGGKSFFGTFAAGKFQFSAAPHLSIFGDKFVSLPIDATSQWLIASEGRASGPSESVTARLAVRITEKGVAETLRNEGRPALVDQSGNLWLVPYLGKPQDNVKLWRDGKLQQQIQIPSYTGGLLCSDRPGSVYAVTVAGIQHLTTDQNTKGPYRLGELYEIEKTDTAKMQFEGHSRQGCIVTMARPLGVGQTYWVHIIPLPKN